ADGGGGGRSGERRARLRAPRYQRRRAAAARRGYLLRVGALSRGRYLRFRQRGAVFLSRPRHGPEKRRRGRKVPQPAAFASFRRPAPGKRAWAFPYLP